jgi:hypothetical protein
MSKLERIKEVAAEMSISHLKSQCAALSVKLSKVVKADRNNENYKQNLEAWKIMRAEIGKKS